MITLWKYGEWTVFVLASFIVPAALLLILIVKRMCFSRPFGPRDDRLWSSSHLRCPIEMQNCKHNLRPPNDAQQYSQTKHREHLAVRRRQSRHRSPWGLWCFNPSQNEQKNLLSIEAKTESVLPQGFHCNKHNVHANTSASAGKWIKLRPFTRALECSNNLPLAVCSCVFFFAKLQLDWAS